jgi:hypothetical protein
MEGTGSSARRKAHPPLDKEMSRLVALLIAEKLIADRG